MAPKSINEKEKKTLIAILVNSLFYLMEHVFIVMSDDGCRLVAICDNRVMADQYYRTLKGAKISFARVFRTNPWQKKKKPVWSHFFPPDEQWMAEKWKIINQNR